MIRKANRGDYLPQTINIEDVLKTDCWSSVKLHPYPWDLSDDVCTAQITADTSSQVSTIQPAHIEDVVCSRLVSPVDISLAGVTAVDRIKYELASEMANEMLNRGLIRIDEIAQPGGSLKFEAVCRVIV